MCECFFSSSLVQKSLNHIVFLSSIFSLLFNFSFGIFILFQIFSVEFQTFFCNFVGNFHPFIFGLLAWSQHFILVEWEFDTALFFDSLCGETTTVLLVPCPSCIFSHSIFICPSHFCSFELLFLFSQYKRTNISVQHIYKYVSRFKLK